MKLNNFIPFVGGYSAFANAYIDSHNFTKEEGN